MWGGCAGSAIGAGLLMCFLAASGTAQARGEATPAAARSSGVVRAGATFYPYSTEGTGLPCIVVGPAPSYSPLFSNQLRSRIRFIFVDFKNSWGAEKTRDLETITMESLVEEIDLVRRALDLNRVCVIGHSVPGLLALEYALRHAEHTSHAILIGMPPYFNRDVIRARTEFWNADASAARKAALQRNVERLPDDVLKSLSPRDAFVLRYVRNGPRYFYDASYDFYWAWAGRQFSAELIERFLSSIAMDYDARPRLLANAVPMFVAIGRYDYAVPHHLWNGIGQWARLTLHRFERSGHFPMLEEVALFDERLMRWLERSR
jgi:proline iminopeptidase